MENEFAKYKNYSSACSDSLTDDNISFDSSDNSDSDIGSYDLEAPPIPENYECPIPYNFRVKATSKRSQTKAVARPPFYLQLDNAIAVIWHIFDEFKDEELVLGIGQLQWALYFLKAIKHPTEGTRSPDIEVAIRAIEDTLLDHYADMANVVKRSAPPQSIPCIICDLEKNNAKNTSCKMCTSAGCNLFGQPKFDLQSFKHSSSTSQKPLVHREQTDEELRNEIEQLKKLAVSLSANTPINYKRKKVRVKPFIEIDEFND